MEKIRVQDLLSLLKTELVLNEDFMEIILGQVNHDKFLDKDQQYIIRAISNERGPRMFTKAAIIISTINSFPVKN